MSDHRIQRLVDLIVSLETENKILKKILKEHSIDYKKILSEASALHNPGIHNLLNNNTHDSDPPIAVYSDLLAENIPHKNSDNDKTKTVLESSLQDREASYLPVNNKVLKSHECKKSTLNNGQDKKQDQISSSNDINAGTFISTFDSDFTRVLQEQNGHNTQRSLPESNSKLSGYDAGCDVNKVSISKTAQMVVRLHNCSEVGVDCMSHQKISEVYSKLQADVASAGNDEIKLFLSYFKGRNDVFAKRWVSPKNGRACYFPQCENFNSLNCPKRFYQGEKANDVNRTKSRNLCRNCSFLKRRGLTHLDIRKHFSRPNYTIGIYPLREDNLCSFVVFDFDDHESDINQVFLNNDSKLIQAETLPDNSIKTLAHVKGSNNKVDTTICHEDKLDSTTSRVSETYLKKAKSKRTVHDEVKAFLKICTQRHISPLVERSRSGKGFHVWLFFEQPILASLARRFGRCLLDNGARLVNIDNYRTYDRMIPTQDTISGNGLGNLIALPLQHEPLLNGNSCFVDHNFNPYHNQFERLACQEKMTEEFVKSEIISLECICKENRVNTRGPEAECDAIDQMFYDDKTVRLNAKSSEYTSKTYNNNEFYLFPEYADDVEDSSQKARKGQFKLTKEMLNEGVFKIYLRDGIYVKNSEVSLDVILYLRNISTYPNLLYFKSKNSDLYNRIEPKRIYCY
ncbi:MAG: TOTE conflict system archaeo-eukaryotic primase domain-containing protein, partial [Succinivibrio sp.]